MKALATFPVSHKQKGAGSMTHSLTVHSTLECSGVTDSPGKETLIYTTIFGITENKTIFFLFCLKVTLIPCEFMFKVTLIPYEYMIKK